MRLPGLAAGLCVGRSGPARSPRGSPTTSGTGCLPPQRGGRAPALCLSRRRPRRWRRGRRGRRPLPEDGRTGAGGSARACCGRQLAAPWAGAAARSSLSPPARCRCLWNRAALAPRRAGTGHGGSLRRRVQPLSLGAARGSRGHLGRWWRWGPARPGARGRPRGWRGGGGGAGRGAGVRRGGRAGASPGPRRRRLLPALPGPDPARAGPAAPRPRAQSGVLARPGGALGPAVLEARLER